jgi:hypothetical protein
MGIRFHCPHCSRKLNVKNFLAGKRGICPYCDAGLDIPLESEVGNGKARHPTESIEVQTVDSALAAAQAFAEPLTIGGSSSQTVVENKTASSENANGAKPAEPVAKSPAPGPVKPDPAKPEPARPDPIDENPEAVWYVRPPSGGQFGPAKGDVMRKWLAEGRVSPDALVWREGWADWQEAEPVFPSLSRRSTPPPPPSAPPPTSQSAASSTATTATAQPAQPATAARAVATDAYTSSAAETTPSATASETPAKPVARKKSNVSALIAIGVLALICVGLFALLIAVATGAFS